MGHGAQRRWHPRVGLRGVELVMGVAMEHHILSRNGYNHGCSHISTMSQHPQDYSMMASRSLAQWVTVYRGDGTLE